VQAARASDLLRRLGLPAQPFSIYGLDDKPRYTAWLYTHDPSPKVWERLQRGLPATAFWLRQEPNPVPLRLELEPQTQAEPPLIASGALAMEADARGNLVWLSAVPDEAWPRRTTRWDDLLIAAGLSKANLKPATPRDVPPMYVEERAAWTGAHDDGVPIRVEAGTFHGIPVYFRIEAPWDLVDNTSSVPFGGPGFNVAFGVAWAIVVATGLILAWINLRRRRGDRVGALRCGVVTFIATFLAVTIDANHVLSVAYEVKLLSTAVGIALVYAAKLGVIYLALEPYVRRRWPDRLISWARLVSGNWRSPMIGRDVLLGIAGGLGETCISLWWSTLPALAGHSTKGHFVSTSILLDNPLRPFAHVAFGVTQGLLAGLGFMIALVVCTILLRRRSFGVAAIFILCFFIFTFASRAWWMLPAFVLISALYTILVSRVGLVAMSAAHFTFICTFFPPAPDAIAWYTMRGLIPLLFVTALAIWAFRTSLGGQSAFGNLALDDA
jgi:hypothetical protein